MLFTSESEVTEKALKMARVAQGKPERVMCYFDLETTI